MERPFVCPECFCTHDEPADARFALFVRCLGCELESLYRADRENAHEEIPRAA